MLPQGAVLTPAAPPLCSPRWRCLQLHARLAAGPGSIASCVLQLHRIALPSASSPLLTPAARPPRLQLCSEAMARVREAELEARQAALREAGLKVPVDLESEFDR